MSRNYFKIVNFGHWQWPDYSSICRHTMPDGIRVIYTPGKWVYPTLAGSKLFVFDSEMDAFDFADELVGMLAIFRCKVKDPELNPAYGLCPDSYCYVEEAWKIFWSKGAWAKPFLRVMPLPTGSAFCSAVKLEPEPLCIK